MPGLDRLIERPCSDLPGRTHDPGKVVGQGPGPLMHGQVVGQGPGPLLPWAGGASRGRQGARAWHAVWSVWQAEEALGRLVWRDEEAVRVVGGWDAGCGSG